MNILEKLEQRATGMCRVDEFERKPVAVELEMAETGEARPTQYAKQYEFELRLRLFSRFWANQAQVSDGRQHAERTLANLLYKDVISELHGIMHAVSDGDRRGAMRRCGELIDSLTR